MSTELQDNNTTDWHSELSLFQGNVYQTTIEDEVDLDYLPLTSVGNAGPIEFYVRGIPGKYRDLNNSKIESKAKVTKEDGELLSKQTGNLSDRQTICCTRSSNQWSSKLMES